VIEKFELDINVPLWLGRLTSPRVSLQRAGVGGSQPYRTARDLHTRPEFRDLADRILGCLPEGYEFISLWANLYTGGNYVTLHDHTKRDKDSNLSGCVFLTHGSPLTFPRESPPISVAPVPGLLIVFPSDAKHCVETSDTPERWSLAFNARRAPAR
jgi:hypothetical protein